MPDMLVKLYDLPSMPPRDELTAQGIEIRRAMSPNKQTILEWVRSQFGEGWASECDMAFASHPIGCFIAVKGKQIVGFACRDATYKDFFGPTGVDPVFRGKGIGTHLLFACLEDMRNLGYAYAIIGGAGPTEFYSKTVGATAIEGSSPGIYKDLL